MFGFTPQEVENPKACQLLCAEQPGGDTRLYQVSNVSHGLRRSPVIAESKANLGFEHLACIEAFYSYFAPTRSCHCEAEVAVS